MTNDSLSYFLKICANSTSYGMFFELTPQTKFNPVKVRVFSGEYTRELSVTTLEKFGEWYFPPIAALITGGAHLLLAMLERSLRDKRGNEVIISSATPIRCVLLPIKLADGLRVPVSQTSKRFHGKK